MTGSSTFSHIIGTESENRVFDSTKQVDHDTLLDQMKNHQRPYGTWFTDGFRGTNGHRYYKDVNFVVESAGPECTNGTEAMHHELAGIMFWSRLARICDRALGRPPQTWIMKSNTSAGGIPTAGYHVNISMPMVADTFEANFAAVTIQLKALVATLQLICGAGVILPKDFARTRLGTRGYGYAISSRAVHVGKDSGAAAHNSADVAIRPMGPGVRSALLLLDPVKPLFLARKEPLADDLRFWRLQICGLDSNILPAAIQLKLDILLIMAEMAAMGAIDPVLLNDKEGTPYSARSVSLDWRTPLETASHGSLTPLEIQWHYFHEAEEYVLGYRKGRGTDILQQWAEILMALDTDEDVPTALNGKVDWVTKALMIARIEAKSDHPLSPSAAENRHFNYHGYQLNPSGLSLPMLLAKRYGAPDIGRKVALAMRIPPADTRAWARGRFIAARPINPSIDWDRIRSGDMPVYRLSDPSIPTSPEFEKYMRMLRRM